MKENQTGHSHELFMERCLELAKNGLGQVAPNPMVGAVIVHKGRVIGEGYHRQYGKPHAEVNAIDSVKDEALLSESTLYVNLEPCSHTGKTPPCSDLIIQKKIPHVVIGISDPNSLVAGRGIEKLRKGGVDVDQNILVEECYNLNRRFFTYHEKKRPYIILKWAQTIDGFMDIERKPGEPIGINWISNPLSRMLVHKWRSEEQGVMVGTNTVLIDNPRLTVRDWEGKNPKRFILDRDLRIPLSSTIYDQSAETLIFNEKKSGIEHVTEWINCSFNKRKLSGVFEELYRREIQSVLVEGGKELLEDLLRCNLWDEARVITGNKKFIKGLGAPEVLIKQAFIEDILSDKLYFYKNLTAN